MPEDDETNMSYHALNLHMDVTIVGAGPTGLSAALYLSSEGVSVTVIDRMSDGTYDRYHGICGMGISDKAFRRLKYIEPCHVRNTIEFGELRFPGDVTVRLPVKGYVIDRVAFLHDLRDRCIEKGCRFVHGTVTDVIREEQGFSVKVRGMENIRCTHVIGCDGAHSVVRKRLFGWRPMEMIPTTECIVEGEPEPTFRMDLGERYQGVYAWTFPAGEHVSIGAKKGLVDTDGCIEHGSRMIPIGPDGPIEDDGAYLCGDAAAMPNPVCAGGLMAGMWAGQVCARNIISGRKGGYQRWWDRSILSSHRFMDFHHTIMEWKDEDFMDASKPFRGCRNIYLSGIKALILKPKYAHEYFGCLQTFRHSW